jgi:hypothetical protein
MDPPCSSKKSTANDDLEFLRDVEAVTGVSGLAPPPNNRGAENSRASAAKPCSGTARRREPSAAAKTRERLSVYIKKYRKMPKLKTNSLKMIKNFVSSILGQTPESPNSEACLQDPVGHPAGKGRAQVCSPVQLSKLRNKEGNININ